MLLGYMELVLQKLTEQREHSWSFHIVHEDTKAWWGSDLPKCGSELELALSQFPGSALYLSYSLADG